MESGWSRTANSQHSRYHSLPNASSGTFLIDAGSESVARPRATFARSPSTTADKFVPQHSPPEHPHGDPLKSDLYPTSSLGLGISGVPESENAAVPQYSRNSWDESLRDGPSEAPEDSQASTTQTLYHEWRTSPSYQSAQPSPFQSHFHENISPGSKRHKAFTETFQVGSEGYTPLNTHHDHTIHLRGRRTWPYVVILVLAIFSTIFSFVFLVLGFRGPRYKWIHSGGSMSPQGANLLTAFLSKAVELSFATVFVAFLGQVLSRRAIVKKTDGRGVTLAEIDMRSWVMQPGTILTHFQALRSSVLTFLGAMSLLAALAAMLYTTAAQALVQPQLRFGPWEPTLLQGSVIASFANGVQIAKDCPTPILNDYDANDGGRDIAGTTCMAIQYAAQSYHNLQEFLTTWRDVAKSGNGSTSLSERPRGPALLFENITVTGSWVEVANVEKNFDLCSRIINNVTLAMPHAGVPGAAREPQNGILQPADLDGQGLYSLQASVPSPAINVLCVSMSHDELEPLVYDAWPYKNASAIPTFPKPVMTYDNAAAYRNKTVVDDIFWWGEKYQTAPPVFAKYPIDYNTILNTSALYGPSSIYMLSKSPSSANYSVCALKVFQTPFCSTKYNASTTGATLEAHCSPSDDDHIATHNPMAYINSDPLAPSGANTTSRDWVTMAQPWATSISLGTGLTDSNASISRLLTEMTLSAPSLNASLPSLAEAMAVLAGDTLLMSTASAPFSPFWTHENAALEQAEFQPFNATLRAQEYASGGGDSAATGVRAFFLVLVAVLVLDLVCLVYLVMHRGLVTDFSEPLNLFSLAVNSPPSEVMRGSEVGPRGEQYRVGWVVNALGGRLVMEDRGLGGQGYSSGQRRYGSLAEGGMRSRISGIWQNMGGKWRK